MVEFSFMFHGGYSGPAISPPMYYVPLHWHRNFQKRWEGGKGAGGGDAEETPVRDRSSLSMPVSRAHTSHKKSELTAFRISKITHTLFSFRFTKAQTRRRSMIWYDPCHAMPKDKKTNSLTYKENIDHGDAAPLHHDRHKGTRGISKARRLRALYTVTPHVRYSTVLGLAHHTDT